MMRLSLHHYALLVCCGCLAVTLLAGCGGTYSGAANDSVEIEVSGTLSLRGSQPYPVLLIETADGGEYLIRSPRLLAELKNLKGMSVALKGTTTKNRSVTIPVLMVDSYRLLPLAGGEEPLVGTIEIAEAGCVLVAHDAKRLTIVGEFEPVLIEFPGAKIWVIGEILDGESIRVSGYGIIVSQTPY